MTRNHRQRKRLIPVGLTVVENLGVAAEDPLAALIRRDDTKALLRYILLLSPRQRQVLCLCGLWGYTQEAAGERLGITKQSVNEYLSAAREHIQIFLASDPDKPPESTPISEDLFTAPIREALEEAADDALSTGGEGFLFAPVLYYAPSRKWLTPYILALDKQAYLDACFGDDLTRIPKGA